MRLQLLWQLIVGSCRCPYTFDKGKMVNSFTPCPHRYWLFFNRSFAPFAHTLIRKGLGGLNDYLVCSQYRGNSMVTYIKHCTRANCYKQAWLNHLHFITQPHELIKKTPHFWKLWKNIASYYNQNRDTVRIFLVKRFINRYILVVSLYTDHSLVTHLMPN